MIFIYGIVFTFFLLLFYPEMRDSIIIDYIFYGSFVLWLISIPVRIIWRFLKKIGGLFPRKIKINRVEIPSNHFPLYGKFLVSETDSMSGTQFEHWCADLLASIGAKNIYLKGGSGDQGVDIIAEIDGIKYAIQCKCYSKPLGNKPVQEVSAGMMYYRCHVGAVMTNNYFTAGGKLLASATGVQLWDRNWIIQKINEINEPIQIEEEPKALPPAFIYQEEGEKDMEEGLWPHQYAPETDFEYFNALPHIGHPAFEVTGIPRFPGVDHHLLNHKSIIEIETSPFDCQADAELYSKYAEKHFCAKTWVEPRDGKYFVVIQTHVYSIQANYWEEDGILYHL